MPEEREHVQRPAGVSSEGNIRRREACPERLALLREVGHLVKNRLAGAGFIGAKASTFPP